MASVALSFARRSETFNMTFSLFTCNVKYIHHRGLNHKQRKTKQTSHSKHKHKLLEGKSERITCSGKHLLLPLELDFSSRFSLVLEMYSKRNNGTNIN